MYNHIEQMEMMIVAEGDWKRVNLINFRRIHFICFCYCMFLLGVANSLSTNSVSQCSIGCLFNYRGTS